MSVADVKGVDVSGLMIDAGSVNSPALLQIGTRHVHQPGQSAQNGWADPADPTGIQDVFFRVGGPHVGKATIALEVNSDDVLLDDIWAWRADHGNGVGWTLNTADTGVVVPELTQGTSAVPRPAAPYAGPNPERAVLRKYRERERSG